MGRGLCLWERVVFRTEKLKKGVDKGKNMFGKNGTRTAIQKDKIAIFQPSFLKSKTKFNIALYDELTKKQKYLNYKAW